MKTVIRNLFLLLVVGLLLAFMGETGCEAKKVRIVPDVKKGQTKTIYTVKRKKGKTTLKKLTAKTSNKSVASVKVAKAKGGKKYYVKVTGKKRGEVLVTVKEKRKTSSGKIKKNTLWFSTEVWEEKQDEKQKAKKAFELQNAVRKKAGQKELEWSEELWEIAKNRVEKDGFDDHENFFKRLSEHFGVDVIEHYENWFSENLAWNTGEPEKAIEAWEKSGPHAFNMECSDWQCGAIAYSEKTNTWVAIFSRRPSAVIDNWKTKSVILRVKRIDSTTGEGISGSLIKIHDETGKEVCRSWESSKNSVCCFIWFDEFVLGKAYKVYEYSAPDGYKKAASVTFVAKGASEGPIEIVLSSDRK